MIQSSTIGKRRIVVPLEFDSGWLDSQLQKHLSRQSTYGTAPKDHVCKPQTYEALVSCVSNSRTLKEAGLHDFAVRLARQLGEHTFKTIYFGFFLGKQNDIESMTRPDSPEVLIFNGNRVPAIYLLMAHFIAMAAMEDLKKVANISLRSLVRSHVRKMISATGSVLREYVSTVIKSDKDHLALINNRGYDYGDHVIFYVHQTKYEDMVTEIRPSTLIESYKSELEIRKLTAKIGPAQEEPVRPKNRSSRQKRSSSNHRAA